MRLRAFTLPDADPEQLHCGSSRTVSQDRHSTVVTRPLRLAALRSLFEIIFLPHEVAHHSRRDLNHARPFVHYPQKDAAMGQRRAHRSTLWQATAFEIRLAGHDRCPVAGIPVFDPIVFPTSSDPAVRLAPFDRLDRFTLHCDTDRRA